MTTVSFAPRSGGGLPDGFPEAGIHACVSNEIWRRAEQLAQVFFARVRAEPGFSRRFGGYIAALGRHLEVAGGKIARLG
jgi:hypothetical protein